MCKPRALRLPFCATLVSATLCLCAGAKANTWDRKTSVTFDEPVEIPGEVLPAGTYVFKLASADSNRHIVQIFNQDETQVLSTTIAVPTYRFEPPDRPVFTFEQGENGSPQVLHGWFYPGEDAGNEFVYPENEYPPNGYYEEYQR